MRRVLIVKTGRTVPAVLELRGDFEDLIPAAMGLRREDVDVVDVTRDQALPAPDAEVAAVVTGSAAMVSKREPWSVRTGEWLAEAAQLGTPILGICYGHQLLADALGGEVGVNPRGREIGTSEVRLTEEGTRDPLLGCLRSPFVVQQTHLESVLSPPPGARVLAENDADPCQAFVVGERVWGVQFHPELDAAIIRQYVEARRETIAQEGTDPQTLLDATTDSDAGHTLLARFADLVR